MHKLNSELVVDEQTQLQNKDENYQNSFNQNSSETSAYSPFQNQDDFIIQSFAPIDNNFESQRPSNNSNFEKSVFSPQFQSLPQMNEITEKKENSQIDLNFENNEKNCLIDKLQKIKSSILNLNPGNGHAENQNKLAKIIKTLYEYINESYDFYNETNDNLLQFQIKAEKTLMKIIESMTNLKIEPIGFLDFFLQKIERLKKIAYSKSDYNEYVFNSYLSNIKHLRLNENLASFYQGNFDQDTHLSYEIDKIESSVIISYCVKSEESGDNLICEFAYAMFDEKDKAHFLNVRNISVNTGFYLPVTTMYFHHDGNKNKLYLCGDIRVKEFTIEGLDNINFRDQSQITILNTNTFYFGDSFCNTSVIIVFNNKLILGTSNKLYIWNIPNTENNMQLEKEYLEIFEIDYDNVDLTRGHIFERKIQLPNYMCQISSLAVLKSSSSNQTFLAVSSYGHPVIYIYDENYKNVSRLISHMMDITCLKSINNYCLFSGSLDMTAKIWNINKGSPEISYNTRNQKITAIEPVFFENKLFLFTGGLDGTVQCFCVTDKKPLFEFVFDKNHVVYQIGFVTDDKHNGHAKLMIITKDDICNWQIRFFEYNKQ